MTPERLAEIESDFTKWISALTITQSEQFANNANRAVVDLVSTLKQAQEQRDERDAEVEARTIQECAALICKRCAKGEPVKPNRDHNDYAHSLSPYSEEHCKATRIWTRYAGLTGQLADSERAKEAAEAKLADYREALQRISGWANEAYPAEAFPDQDLRLANEVLAAHGISMSAMHGQWARRLIGGIGEIAKQALAQIDAPKRPDKPLPPAKDLTGSDPDFTGGLSTDEYIRSVRGSAPTAGPSDTERLNKLEEMLGFPGNCFINRDGKRIDHLLMTPSARGSSLHVTGSYSSLATLRETADRFIKLSRERAKEDAATQAEKEQKRSSKNMESSG
jgi:hypothetical protein